VRALPLQGFELRASERVGFMDSQDVRFYLSVYLQRLHYFLPPIVVVTVIGLLAALLLQPIYRSVAKILVESPRISADLARPSVQADAVQQLQVLEQELMTRASLLSMAEKFAIYPRGGLSQDEIAGDMLARTRVEPFALSDLGSNNSAVAFTISFDAEDPVLAAEVANGFATAILDANARERKAIAEDAHAFFKREADRLKGGLQEAQDAILAFKREHSDALPENLEFRRMQQQANEERLRQLQREVVSLQQKRSTIEQILASSANGGGSTSTRQKLADLQRALAEQESIFSEDSPNLQMLRSRIADLEKRLSEERAEATDMSQRADISPELRVQFADIEGQLKLIAQERQSVEGTLADLARSIAETEVNSTTLSVLEQSYATAQTQYNEAAGRLAEASTGQRIENEAIGEKLTLIEPATPPARPIWPKRKAIVLASFGVGVGLSFALFFLMELWSPKVRRPADLASEFEGQPFATIPYIANGNDGFARKLAMAVATVVVVFALAGLLLVQQSIPVLVTASSTQD
jgi:uncharacterized protein involved in exopolysaccharide biosynthesis